MPELSMENRREVPESVVFDILLFLPVVSLLRFKSVCKAWCSMIESSSFVTRHLYHNRENNNLICADMEGELYMFSGIINEMMGSKLNVERWEHGKTDFRVVNSCDGIVCLAHHTGNDVWVFTLWNPATKQVRQLPEPSDFHSYENTVYNAFAFGYERKTRDYKIVRIALELNSDRLHNSVAEVYSMRRDAWRTTHEGCKDFPDRWAPLRDVVVECNNEICIWIGSSLGERSVHNTEYDFLIYSLVYFDLGNEVFGEVATPDTLLSWSCELTCAFLSEKIALVKCCKCKDGSDDPYPIVYEIWVMDEFGKKESWNQVYRVEETVLPSVDIHKTKLLMKNGRFVVRAKQRWSRDENNRVEEEGIYLLDLVTLQEFFLLPVNWYWSTAINYSESLVSVNSTG